MAKPSKNFKALPQPALPPSLQGLVAPQAAPMSGAPDPNAPSAQAGGATTPPGGTASYMPPTAGPFECDNCQFFTQGDQCTRPEVIAELGPAPGSMNAQVDAKGCCNYFTPLKAQGSK